MESTYDWWLVALSVVTSVFASFTALSLAARVRRASGKARWTWLLLAAVAMGGGIWAMHFIAMLAFHMQVPVAYDVGLTLLSVLLAILFTGLGQWIVAVKGSAPAPLLSGGLCMGLGVNTMHYTGMAAMRMPAEIVYDPVIVGLSVGIAVVAGTAALWLSFNLSSARARLVSALVMAAAVCGMHYTGMAAASYTCTARTLGAESGIATPLLAVAIGVATFAILCLALLLAIVDQRFEARTNEEAERLRRSDERFRSLIQNAADVIVVADARGVMTFVSPSVERSLGYTKEFPISREPRDFVHPQEHPKLLRFFEAIRAAPLANVTQEFRLRRGDGLYGDFEVVGTNLLEDPAVNGIVFNVRDISARRENAVLEQKVAERTADLARMNDELSRAKDHAEAANRLKSQFLATMSHELRTPLNAVIGFSDILRTRAVGSVVTEQHLEYVEHINRSGRHLLTMVNGILDLSKIEAGAVELHEEVFDLAAVLEEAVRMVTPQAAEGGVELAADLPGSALLLKADEILITRIFVNLLSNGVKFTPRGGRVALATAFDPNGALRVQIADTGIGIAPQDIPKILSPFTQVDNSFTRRHEGTGLGLPIAKSLAELHRGTLEIASALGRGTTVTVTLPAERIRPDLDRRLAS